jgi:hypothetical protein
MKQGFDSSTRIGQSAVSSHQSSVASQRSSRLLTKHSGHTKHHGLMKLEHNNEAIIWVYLLHTAYILALASDSIRIASLDACVLGWSTSASSTAHPGLLRSSL